MNTADQALVKKMNKALILEQIIANAPISRAKLSEITGLNKSTVSSQVSSLLQKEMIFETGRGESSGGRRPVMLKFNRKAGYAVGVDIGTNYMIVVLTDLEGNIIEHDERDLDEEDIPATEQALIELVGLAIEKMPPSPYGLAGIGVCVPGLVDNAQQVVFTPNKPIHLIDLKNLLEEKFNVPIFIENEANAGALGEKEYGDASHLEHAVFVSINAGIGLGILMNGKLFRGVEGFSGEAGHMSIDFNGPACRCGNKGCWELYASEKAVFSSFLSNTEAPLHQIVKELADRDDPNMLKTFETFGFYIGVGLLNIIKTLNPGTIILRNTIVESYPMIVDSIKKTISSRSAKEALTDYQLKISSLGRIASSLGVSRIVIERFLEQFMNEMV
ncbi:ROK family transcriptional regulator [Bacillus swezeyi]|uniref:XylR family transcriptional regulator n=1 Tax=Bacillus swezeyi TaxID=1925020 RepID=A0A1R1QWT2_9BACI|nr:ROK family transcriptional regulator [Bacillus swezeyi]MEC1259156.1 ROK family transcriptional regulator [Bacillus swezeyi]MED2927883.1 ROK family transcriptional regulator [Bacillus swezeyi]MED2965205.1 ROK family transcriptional regulator [Bacillus swezeyi]MED2977689.1 ROK family transcriptional regulator [Bacillus swezeyi]MED3071466.1 ROK family transcriptional regulator [Bacillus swezeyi]